MRQLRRIRRGEDARNSVLTREPAAKCALPPPHSICDTIEEEVEHVLDLATGTRGCGWQSPRRIRIGCPCRGRLAKCQGLRTPGLEFLAKSQIQNPPPSPESYGSRSSGSRRQSKAISSDAGIWLVHGDASCLLHRACFAAEPSFCCIHPRPSPVRPRRRCFPLHSSVPRPFSSDPLCACAAA